MKPTTLITIGVDGTVVRKDQACPPGLELLQAAVGGYIEAVPHFDRFEDWPCVAWCDEEGLLKGLPLNVVATELWLALFGEGPFRYPPRLHGTVVVVGGRA